MSTPARIELGEVIEHQVFGRFALLLLVLTSLTMFLEGFEMQLVGYTAPVMSKALHVDKATFSSIFAATYNRPRYFGGSMGFDF